jgi:hypothetical protein
LELNTVPASVPDQYPAYLLQGAIRARGVARMKNKLEAVP